MAKAEIDVIIMTDPSAEIDDENMLKLLMANGLGNGSCINALIYTVPGKVDGNPSENALFRLQGLKNLFPNEWGTSNEFTNSLGTFRIDVIDNLPESNISVDVFIQIAPMMCTRPLVNIKADVMIFMGNWDDPSQSMNGTKAFLDNEKELELYEAQRKAIEMGMGKIISIPTNLARQTALSPCLVASFGNIFSEKIFDCAFKQFVGRPDPSQVWARPIAEVNKNSIFKTVLYDEEKTVITSGMSELRNSVSKQERKTSPDLFKVITDAQAMVDKFLYGHPGGIDSADGPDEMYHSNIIQIIAMIYLVTGCTYIESDRQEFSISSIEYPIIAKAKWMIRVFSKNSGLTPPYDVLALIVLQEVVKGNTKLPSLDFFIFTSPRPSLSVQRYASRCRQNVKHINNAIHMTCRNK